MARSKQIAWKPSGETRKGTGLEQVCAALYEVSESAREEFSTIILTLQGVIPPPGVMWWCAHAAGVGGERVGVTVMYKSCSSCEVCFQSLVDKSHVFWALCGGWLCPMLFSKFTTSLAGQWCPEKGPHAPQCGFSVHCFWGTPRGVTSLQLLLTPSFLLGLGRVGICCCISSALFYSNTETYHLSLCSRLWAGILFSITFDSTGVNGRWDWKTWPIIFECLFLEGCKTALLKLGESLADGKLKTLLDVTPLLCSFWLKTGARLRLLLFPGIK